MQTWSRLRIRLSEHECNIENKRLKKVLPAHCHNNNHSMNWRAIKILDFEPHWYRRRVSEMINIHLQDSKINKNKDTKSLHNSYINVIDKLTQL